MNHQIGILEAVSDHAVFLEWEIAEKSVLPGVVEDLSGFLRDSGHVFGMGADLTRVLGLSVPGLEPFPDYSTSQMQIPSTQTALLVIVRSDMERQAADIADTLELKLAPGFRMVSRTGAFKYEGGRDLTGYEDGTENPVGDAAFDAAIVKDQGEMTDGSSFVAVQRWLHDFPAFDSMSRAQQDDAIGRYRDTNEEFDAPEFAHVKRTAQESFDPEAFVVRRSMPWRDTRGSGLMFVAYGRNFQAFDAQIRRMTGSVDGIVDGLFGFTRPVTGGFYWCPPRFRPDLMLAG